MICNCTVIQESGRRTRCDKEVAKNSDYCYHHSKVFADLPFPYEPDPSYMKRYSGKTKYQPPDFIIAYEGKEGKRIDISSKAW